MSFLLLALTGAFAYFVGSLSTVQIASHLVFRKTCVSIRETTSASRSFTVATARRAFSSCW